MPNLLKTRRKRAEAKESQCARSADLTESDRQALFHTPPVYTRDCPACGTRFDTTDPGQSQCSQCARSAEPDEFAELASWSVERLAKWMSQCARSADELRALDEAAAELPEADRVVVEARIAEAYTLLARGQLADIAEAKQVAKAEPAEPAAVEAGEPGADEDLAAWRARLTEMGLPVDGLHTWDAHRIQNWIFNHPSVEALRALDELADTLTGVRRAKILKEIATAYANLASANWAGITIELAMQRREVADQLWDRVEKTFALRGYTMEEASQCARSADELRDLDEEKEAIVEALTRWQESVPQGDELLELVQVRRPGYFALEDLGAALVELQQANVLAVDRTGGWYLTGDATPAEQGPVVTMVPVSTGTVIAHIRHDGAERYTLQSGAYKLDIVLPADYAEVTKLLMALLAAVSMRLEGFQEGPFAHVLTHKAWRAVMAALALVADDEPARCYAVDTPGPGGACHKFECAGITVQFQRGARGEPDSVAGVLDPDLLEVCKHVLYQREMPFGDDFELLARGCIELAINKLTERVTERIGRGVFGRHAA